MHERRYPKLNRKQLKNELTVPSEEGQHSNKELFDACRAKVVEVLTDMDRLPPGFGSLAIMPLSRVEQTSRQAVSSKRRGMKYRLDKFVERFPDKDPKKLARSLRKRTGPRV